LFKDAFGDFNANDFVKEDNSIKADDSLSS